MNEYQPRIVSTQLIMKRLANGIKSTPKELVEKHLIPCIRGMAGGGKFTRAFKFHPKADKEYIDEVLHMLKHVHGFKVSWTDRNKSMMEISWV